MQQQLIYRAPEPSRATRTISRRSRASLRGGLVAKLPLADHPRVIQFESALEYRFLCLTLVRDDVSDVWDQPPAVTYAKADGRMADHVFDFLVTLNDGERIAVAVKPIKRVVARNFVAELERIAAGTSKHFADRVVLVTDQHLDRSAAAEAARQLTARRSVSLEVLA